MLGLCYWVGVNEKVQNTGETMPIFFGNVLFLFQHFSSSFKHPSPHMGSAVFLNIWLTQTCIAIAVPLPPHGNLTKALRARQGNSKLNVRKKVFECTTLLKIEVIEYGKMGF